MDNGDDMVEIKILLAEIQKDLKYHIKRTDTLETMITPPYKLYIFGLYFLKALVPISIMAGLFLQFHK